jgi:ElaB/YqjD/DUF883 family membrane-anchored ribosome-binding protein
MGQGTNSLEPEQVVQEAGEKVERSRRRLDRLVSELDRRRHLVVRTERAVRSNPALAIGLAAVGLTIIGGGIVLAVRHHQQRQLLSSRVARLRTALARMIDHPDHVAASGSTVPGKIAAAAGSTVATILIKRALASLARPEGAATGAG